MVRERDLGVLGDIHDLDVVELACGTTAEAALDSSESGVYVAKLDTLC